MIVRIMIDLKYNRIENGFIFLDAIKDNNKVELVFDELLSDPIPQFVNFYNHVKNGENWKEEIKELDGRRILNIFATKIDDNYFQFEMDCFESGTAFWGNIKLKDLINKFEEIFDKLLNDKDFPHLYPCFWHHEHEIFESVSDEAWELSNHDIDIEDELMRNFFREGRIPLEDREEEIVEKFKKMLIEYKIPEGWI